MAFQNVTFIWARAKILPKKRFRFWHKGCLFIIS